MAHFVVTGATGFIGRHLVPRLIRQGNQVTCAVRQEWKGEMLRAAGAETQPADLCDAASLARLVAKADAVFHLAAATRGLHRAEFDRMNRQGVDNLLAACARRTNPPPVVLVSSLAAVGPSIADQPWVESDPARPVSWYGRTKLAGELAAMRWSRHVPITIVRPPMVIGEGDIYFFTLVRMIASMRLYVVPGLKPVWLSMIYAGDLGEALYLALERGKRLRSEATGEGFYFVADEPAVTLADLGRWTALALGRRACIVRVPGPLVWCGGAAYEAGAQLIRRPLSFGLDKAREALAGSWTCSSDRARRELGFIPRVSAREGVRRAVDWYREQGWLY